MRSLGWCHCAWQMAWFGGLRCISDCKKRMDCMQKQKACRRDFQAHVVHDNLFAWSELAAPSLLPWQVLTVCRPSEKSHSNKTSTQLPLRWQLWQQWCSHCAPKQQHSRHYPLWSVDCNSMCEATFHRFFAAAQIGQILARLSFKQYGLRTFQVRDLSLSHNAHLRISDVSDDQHHTCLKHNDGRTCGEPVLTFTQRGGQNSFWGNFSPGNLRCPKPYLQQERFTGRVVLRDAKLFFFSWFVFFFHDLIIKSIHLSRHNVGPMQLATLQEMFRVQLEARPGDNLSRYQLIHKTAHFHIEFTRSFGKCPPKCPKRCESGRCMTIITFVCFLPQLLHALQTQHFDFCPFCVTFLVWKKKKTRTTTWRELMCMCKCWWKTASLDVKQSSFRFAMASKLNVDLNATSMR